MKTLIAIPTMDQVAAEFAYSLAAMNKVGDCVLGFEISSLIYDARNTLTRKAVNAEADYILWIDSDMVFGQDLMERLMADIEGRDIVTGLYFMRRSPYHPVLMKSMTLSHEPGMPAECEPYLDYPKDRLFEVAGCGFGCVLMRTEVAVEMALEYQEWFKPFGGVGEDLAFCARATQMGKKIWCDPTIKLGHVGRAIVTEDVFLKVGKNVK